MDCPKCQFGMEQVDCQGVIVDRCTQCQGLWFDQGEAETLSDQWITQFLDIGDPGVGKQYDEMDDVACPRCGETMRRFFDPEDLRMQYEQCDKHGIFFDAGEFTIWAEKKYL